MRSPMIENADYIKDKERYTDLQVCKSAAGYYVGTMYNNPEGYIEPGSRDTGYYETAEKAEQALRNLIVLGGTTLPDGTIGVREQP